MYFYKTRIIIRVFILYFIWTFKGLLEGILIYKGIKGGFNLSILHKCRKSGCHELVDTTSDYCQKHTRAYAREYDKLRTSRELTKDYRRFYHSKAWRELRVEKLSLDPLCEECTKHHIYTLATEIHHKHEVFYHWSERLDIENLESLCKSCHEKIHKSGYYRAKKF